MVTRARFLGILAVPLLLAQCAPSCTPQPAAPPPNTARPTGPGGDDSQGDVLVVCGTTTTAPLPDSVLTCYYHAHGD